MCFAESRLYTPSRRNQGWTVYGVHARSTKQSSLGGPFSESGGVE